VVILLCSGMIISYFAACGNLLVRGCLAKCEQEMFQASLYCSTEPTQGGCYLARDLPNNFGFPGIKPLPSPHHASVFVVGLFASLD